MKVSVLFIILTFISCGKTHIEKEFYYTDGGIKERRILRNSNDTLNYTSYRFDTNGVLVEKFSIVNGLPDGKYYTYYEDGSIHSRSNYVCGSLDGIVAILNEEGRKLRESFYVNNIQVLFSEFYTSEDESFEKQVFYFVKQGKAFPIGQLVVKNGEIHPNMSLYANITGADTISNLPYCFTLKIYEPNDEAKFEIISGKPDTRLNIIDIDTSFVTFNRSVELCATNMKYGINNIFFEINVLSDDTATFYVYKELYLIPKEDNNDRNDH